MKKIKPSDIFKVMLGTKEGRAYLKKEMKQFHKDVCEAAEKQFFGNEGKEHKQVK